MTNSVCALGATLLLLCASEASAETPRVLAEFPAGAFLENLNVAEDGTVLVTSYFSRTLERITPDGAVATFSTLPAHPVSLVPLNDGWLVAAHGSPFTEGPAFTQTQHFLRLDALGNVTAEIAAPDALFLNGMAKLPDGRLLVADSIAGIIWTVDSESGAMSPWLRDEILTQPADMQAFQPGANGLKLHDGAIFVSNSARGTLHRLPIDADGAVGTPELVAEPGRIDDFWVDLDGSVIVATHADTLVRLAPDGARDVLLTEGCDACTAVAPRGSEWIVLTTGGLLEGANLPARVLSVPRS